MDLKPLFDLYLRTTNKLEVFVKQVPNGYYQVSLTNLDMNIPLKIITSDGEQTITAGKKAKAIKSSSVPVIDPDKYYLTRLIFE